MTQLRRMFCLATFVAAATLFVMRPLLVRGQSGTTVLTPVNGGQVASPRVVINNGGADHNNPHVSGDLAAYTEGSTTQSIHYYRFSTAVDQAIPTPTSAFDSLSDVSGNRIVFTRGAAGCDSILFFDVGTASLIEVAPQPCPQRFGASIGGNTLAYTDFATDVVGVTFASDLSSPGPGFGTVQLSSGSGTTQNPEVAASGTVVVWEQCGSLNNCDVMAAVFNPAPANTWNSFLVTNSASSPDTDGTWIVYDASRAGNATGRDIYFKPVAGDGVERQLAIAGEQSNASIRQGVIAFESRSAAGVPADTFVYVIATNTLYQVTNTPTIDDHLTDVDVLPNGDVRVVWVANDGLLGVNNVYGITFTPAGGDFSFSSIAALNINAGGSGSTTVTINPLSGFSSAVDLSVSGQPAGVTASLSPNAVTPSGGSSVSSVLNVSVPSFLTPTNFSLTVTGASGALSHSATANITVTATTASTSNSIGDMLNAGCIDNAGVANALNSKLSAAQGAGNVQTAINTLTALKNQIQAQGGKHIHTACAIGGVAFNPVNVLLLDVQALIDGLRVSLIPDPTTGYVVDATGMGVAGATVSILDSGNAVVASATTDITGFYFMATTGVLTPGGAYTIAVTGLPAGFGTVTPPNQTFTWQGSAVGFSNFVVN